MNMKTKNILRWVGIGVLTLQFLAAAVGKFTGAWDQKFNLWGYPSYATYLVGILEVAAAGLLFIPALRKWGSVMMMMIMAGAAATHLLHGEWPRMFHNLIVASIAFAVMRPQKS